MILEQEHLLPSWTPGEEGFTPDYAPAPTEQGREE